MSDQYVIMNSNEEEGNFIEGIMPVTSQDNRCFALIGRLYC